MSLLQSESQTISLQNRFSELETRVAALNNEQKWNDIDCIRTLSFSHKMMDREKAQQDEGQKQKDIHNAADEKCIGDHCRCRSLSIRDHIPCVCVERTVWDKTKIELCRAPCWITFYVLVGIDDMDLKEQQIYHCLSPFHVCRHPQGDRWRRYRPKEWWEEICVRTPMYNITALNYLYSL